MKPQSVVASLLAVCASTLAVSAAAQLNLQQKADEVVNKVELDKANKFFKQSGKYKGEWTVDLVFDKNTKISSKKFNIGAMDADDKAAPFNKIKKDQCERYVLSVKIRRKDGGTWDEVHKVHGHGVWEEAKAPGQVSKCVVKDGWGTAPNVWTKPLKLPTQGDDVYRVVVASGFTKKPWPKNTDDPVDEVRPAKVAVSMMP